MYLKKIELQGFKSFPDKIRLEFGRGITAVVGPNGSGKSNIADAVRWVLGEQSAKALRGGKMEDVIFAGTSNRRQLGFAEVTLVIDNSDRKLPMEFLEISVVRRVYRSGESEYRINGTVCRLRDIHELFMDTGVGKEGYSIIGQGRIEEILSTRSEDRRLLFEEAAGIVKYRSRKHESEQRLARERANLVRVGDIISELELNLEPLKMQSEAAKTYLSLRERLKLLQINIFLLNTERVTIELSQLDKNISALSEQILRESKRKDGYCASMDELKRKLENVEADIKHCGELDKQTRVMAETREGDIKLSSEQKNNIDKDIARLRSEIQEDEAEASTLEENLKAEQARLKQIEMKYSLVTEILSASQKSFDDANKRLEESEKKISEFNSLIMARMNAISDARGQTQIAKAAHQRLEELKEGLNSERAETTANLRQCTARTKELANALNESDTTLKNAGEDINELLKEKNACEELLAANQQRMQAINQKLNENKSRHRLLAELESGYEGYLKSVKAVLTRKHHFSGIYGAVVELLETDAQYETCIEIALGGAAQNIITASEEDASAAIEYLKRTKSGRATFLPLTAVEPRTLGSKRGQILSKTGVCGVALELVRYDPLYENVFANLLGRVIVVDNIHNAIPLAKEYRYSYKIVTLEGELLSTGGAMTGGSVHKVMSLISRGREIKELRLSIDKLTKISAGLNTEIDGLKEQLIVINTQIDEKRGILRQAELERAALTAAEAQASELLFTLKRKTHELEEQDIELIERLRAASDEICAYEQEAESLERDAIQLREQLSDFQNAMTTEKEQKEAGIRELLDAKSEISALEQKISAAKDNIQRLAQTETNLHSAINKRRAQIDERMEQGIEAKRQLEQAKLSLDELKLRQLEIDSELKQLEAAKAEWQTGLMHVSQEEREIATLLSDLNAENVRLEMKKEQVTENNRRLYDAMWDEYGITYQTAIQYERLAEPENRLLLDERKIKAEIHALGNINVSAIEEYKSVKERYEFLTAQRDDILLAEAKLKNIIAELTRLMERQFEEQFKLISENFSFVFQEMFGGGKAYLQLSDDKNILEAGIDIIAQPPGKNLQSMSLLSGGERALTATALLFGILRMKPSPFCILDEIEAALDDSNVIRYASYLKGFSSDTQFIIITHRKGTMEAADVLYGVTMQEQGVSKLVSVKFTEA